MRKKYLFDGYDIIYDDITTDMVTVGSQDIDIDAIINSVSQKINQPPAEKKTRRRKHITLPLIAAVLISSILIPGLIISASEIVEMLFNMDEPFTQEMRNEVEQENRLRYCEYILQNAIYKMNNPDEDTYSSSDYRFSVKYNCERDKVYKVLNILEKYGYDTGKFDADKMITFEFDIQYPQLKE